MERKLSISNQDGKIAELMGGEEEKEDLSDYTRPKLGTHYADGGGHARRSLVNDPNHKAHWGAQVEALLSGYYQKRS